MDRPAECGLQRYATCRADALRSFERKTRIQIKLIVAAVFKTSPPDVKYWKWLRCTYGICNWLSCLQQVRQSYPCSVVLHTVRTTISNLLRQSFEIEAMICDLAGHLWGPVLMSSKVLVVIHLVPFGLNMDVLVEVQHNIRWAAWISCGGQTIQLGLLFRSTYFKSACIKRERSTHAFWKYVGCLFAQSVTNTLILNTDKLVHFFRMLEKDVR